MRIDLRTVTTGAGGGGGGGCGAGTDALRMAGRGGSARISANLRTKLWREIRSRVVCTHDSQLRNLERGKGREREENGGRAARFARG